jgi:hypothetical protein
LDWIGWRFVIIIPLQLHVVPGLNVGLDPIMHRFGTRDGASVTTSLIPHDSVFLGTFNGDQGSHVKCRASASSLSIGMN